MMAGVTLEVVQLSKRYASRSAVEDVSFTAHAGEVLGLLGPNGAGKTTTIPLLTTMIAPTSGTFRVAGLPPTAAAEIRRRVGVLPESSGYPGQQTGREYLRYHARLYGLSSCAGRRVADRLLADLGLEERARSPIARYSRGLRQRLGIARALVHDPAVVFLDEPTLGLDPAGQSEVLSIIRDIAQSRGATVVLSTHTLPEVEEVCSSVLILDRGRVVVAGSVGEVIEMAVVERSAQLRVPAEQVPQARLAVGAVAGLSVDLVEGQPDVLSISLRPSPGGPSMRASNAMNPAVVAVAEAGVPILSFRVEGARLSDAYRKATATDAR
jgi:ABC-2 type transport system ATP-binding protein